ncbi:hypothetical protein PAXRUDRAFT_822866 [Paxillus rubicundulus Ve08.2h10]|uniref:Uncharacterized protein n=1 Tax=Paxillus rubicundulus Ve08.2h10 TaxID=930991 RepID=A0A0D0DW17_9AGAM|nr:hypothetical protein PAXRUDRAFT_822866 [Paxillus rubicundulus Ve08.2h10]
MQVSSRVVEIKLNFNPAPSFRRIKPKIPTWKLREGISDASGLSNVWTSDGGKG